jgi:hypothetical protein
MLVTSDSVFVARKRSRISGETFLSEPDMLATFMMRPVDLMRGRKVWHAERVE